MILKFAVYSVLLFVYCIFIDYFAGNDRGTQYRSGFYYFNEEQEKLIKASKEAYEARLEEKTGMKRPITTEIAAATDYDKYGGLWYFAEAYHQQVRLSSYEARTIMY